MAYEEISKVHKELGKLIENSFELRKRAAREFATQKNLELRDIAAGNIENNIMLEFNRYISHYLGEERGKNIPKNIDIQRIKIGTIPAEWISVPGAMKETVFLYLFGGGYMMGDLESRRWIPYLFSRATKLRCLNIEYRLAPENPFPAALEDSIKSYKWLLSNGFDPKKIIIGGDSAGGGLTIATFLKLKEEKISIPAAGVLMSPWADLTGEANSIIRNQKFEPLIKEGLQNMAKSYAGDDSLKNPLISPVFADLNGIPPIIIQAGGIEALLDDSITLAEHAKQAGVKVILEVYENMTHVFQNFGEELFESKKAFENINKFIQKIL